LAQSILPSPYSAPQHLAMAASSSSQLSHDCEYAMDDQRGEGDPDWLGNGSQIKLVDLQAANHLNGKVAEVIGFDNNLRRYRVQLHDGGTVKVVAKKNLQLLEPLMMQPAGLAPRPPFAVPVGGNGDREQVALSSRVPMPSHLPLAQLLPSRETVNKAAQTAMLNVEELRNWCERRQRGDEQAIDAELSDVFLRVNVSVDTLIEVMELYRSSEGEDEEFQRLGEQALKTFDECAELYCSVRSWTELGKDELNLTKLNVKKRGLLGLLREEVADMGKDAGQLIQATSEVVRNRAPQASEQGREIIRSAHDAAYGLHYMRRNSQAAVNAAHTRVQQSFVEPVRRTWSLIVAAFFVCFLIPLFALRAYAPMNSVVSNLGIVYSVVVLICPPRCAQSRRMRACLLVLWPVFLVALPVAVHYWLTHPRCWENLRSQLNRRSSPKLEDTAFLVGKVGAASSGEAPSFVDKAREPGRGAKGGEKLVSSTAVQAPLAAAVMVLFAFRHRKRRRRNLQSAARLRDH